MRTCLLASFGGTGLDCSPVGSSISPVCTAKETIKPNHNHFEALVRLGVGNRGGKLSSLSSSKAFSPAGTAGDPGSRASDSSDEKAACAGSE